MSAAAPSTDVAIAGGGLAGLCLALQLRRALPSARIVVLERRTHPVPEAAFKVGESTVEIGAYYFARVLGLQPHLDGAQLRKFGFRFFFSDGRDDIDACTELGVSQLLPTPSWQIDRGRFENMLAERVRAEGIDLRTGCTVRRIEMGQEGASHRVDYTCEGEARSLDARWLVDAAGRAGLLRRKFDLTLDNGHDANAVWWRVEGHLDPNDWSGDAAWRGRCDPPDRWRSTNHLCGPGYWAWMIPLASGSHSLGIVCDAATHPLATMNSHAKAMAWLHEHQPRLARALDDPSHAVQDFAFLRGYSHGCRQVFSADRWALTGEAGPFLDPFYSPGSDFIAIANTYITALVERDLGGGSIAAHAALYEQVFQSFYDNMLPIYRGQYGLLGDAQVLPVKLIWDYTFYWAMLAPLMFGERLADPDCLGRIRPRMQQASELNRAVQALLHDWGEANARSGVTDPAPGRFLDQYRIDWFRDMNGALDDPLDDEAFVDRIAANGDRMEALAREVLARARQACPRIDDHGLDEHLAPPGATPDRQLDDAWYALA
ncbi:NAD(P)/FAD-dependent oxidoreductase [Marilutibacter aestuarii]|uniref:Halogenase n=1 Tax=Marilutibacter aestuarii TaxID=1706195 RepID=A0A508AQS3_9GAMM|nr:tryptophan 7-halogenase [Lysobacter aestuarii]TQD51293.1 halogenase [Lysobacter aestuarii]